MAYNYQILRSSRRGLWWAERSQECYCAQRRTPLFNRFPQPGRFSRFALLPFMC